MRLKEAMKDYATMNRYFTTPTSMLAGAHAALQMQSHKRQGPGDDRGVPSGSQFPPAQLALPGLPGQPLLALPPPPEALGGLGKGKGGKKRTRNGGWKKGASGKGKSVDGSMRRKCGLFQRGKCTKGAQCPDLHACWVCHSPDHGQKDCPRRPANRPPDAGDAAGRPRKFD